MSASTECTGRSYCTTISNREFELIERRDEQEPLYCGLLKTLERVGAQRVEYSGHFGAAIFYDLRAEDDTEEKRREIERIIVEYAAATKA